MVKVTKTHSFVNVGINSVVVHWEDVCVRVVAADAQLMNVIVRFAVETFSKNGHYENVDQERYEERDRGLDEKILVSFAHCRALPTINVTRLD